ncbi:MAG: hypothetical protein ACYC09_11225 [Bacteroidota bacterium]
MENVRIYTSAFVFEIDMVREYFNKEQIPYFVQVENLGGVTGAFPASPTSGFGIRYHISVPKEIVGIAKEKISNLPISKNSDKNPFPLIDSKILKKSLWKVAIIVLPYAIILGWLFYSALNK